MHQDHVQPWLGNSQELYGASDRGIPYQENTCLEIFELLNLVKSEKHRVFAKIDEISVDGFEKDEL